MPDTKYQLLPQLKFSQSSKMDQVETKSLDESSEPLLAGELPRSRAWLPFWLRAMLKVSMALYFIASFIMLVFLSKNSNHVPQPYSEIICNFSEIVQT